MRAAGVAVTVLALLLLTSPGWFNLASGSPAHPTLRGAMVPGGAGSESQVVAATTYPVTFTESGLPPGTNWSVTLNDTTRSAFGPTIAFAEPNGTYPLYAWDVLGFRSEVNVTSVHVSGASVGITVSYTPPTPGTYFVTLVQLGLPLNDYWTILLSLVTTPPSRGGLSATGPGPTHTMAGSNDGVGNGTFVWTATLTNMSYFPGDWYYPFPSQGQVVVHGSSVLIHLAFRYSYPFSFFFGGLPTSTTWTLQILNETFTGNGGVNVWLLVELPNGTYGWNATAPGYRAQNGTVTVLGNKLTNVQQVYFQALPSTFASPAWGWWVLAGIVVVALAVGLLLLIRRRREDSDPPPPPPTV